MALANMELDKVKFTFLLAEREMKMYEVAKVAGIAASTLNGIVNDKNGTSPATLGKIARALQVSVEDIIIKEEQR